MCNRADDPWTDDPLQCERLVQARALLLFEQAVDRRGSRFAISFRVQPDRFRIRSALCLARWNWRWNPARGRSDSARRTLGKRKSAMAWIWTDPAPGIRAGQARDGVLFGALFGHQSNQDW